MYRISDARGTGKTCQLLLLAKENNGVVVCIHPKTMKEKAERYGLVGIDYLSYNEYIELLKKNNKIVNILASVEHNNSFFTNVLNIELNITGQK